MQLYRGIIKQALNISWKSKYLWFFGLFAALLGNGGEYEILYRALSGNFNNDFFGSFKAIVQTGVFSMQGLRNLADLLVSQPISVIVAILILVIVLALLAFVIWLVNVSQAALVNNTMQKIDNKKVTFREALDNGMQKFWPVFGFNLVSKFITIISLSIISLIVIFGNNLGSNMSIIIYVFVVLLFIPIAMSFSFIVKYGIGYSVINDMKFLSAFESGWNLFKKNWLISLEMAFILYALNIIIALLFIVVVLIFATPFALLAFLASSLSMTGMFLFVIGLGIIFFFVFLVVTGSLLATFQISAWTSLFVELIGKGAKSKLVRIFGR